MVGHELDLHDVRVDRVLAGQQRIDPDALAAAGDEVAVGEGVARHVDVLGADVADDDADVADRDLGHRRQVDLDEPRVQVPRAGQEDVLLQAAAAAGVDERLAVLEAVVAVDRRAGEVAGGDGAAVEHGDDADLVDRDLADEQVIGRGAELPRVVAADDLEERRVDAIGARRDDAHLAAALAAAAQERAGVLEAVALDLAAEDLVGRHRRAVRGDDEGDFSRGDDDERDALHLVEPVPEAEVPARGEEVGLEAGFAVQGDDPAGRQRATEALDDETGFPFADDAKTRQDERKRGDGDGRPGRQPQTPDEGVHDVSLRGAAATVAVGTAAACSGPAVGAGRWVRRPLLVHRSCRCDRP